jgi:hypothetical protein
MDRSQITEKKRLRISIPTTLRRGELRGVSRPLNMTLSSTPRKVADCGGPPAPQKLSLEGWLYSFFDFKAASAWM